MMPNAKLYGICLIFDNFLSIVMAPIKKFDTLCALLSPSVHECDKKVDGTYWTFGSPLKGIRLWCCKIVMSPNGHCGTTVMPQNGCCGKKNACLMNIIEKNREYTVYTLGRKQGL